MLSETATHRVKIISSGLLNAASAKPAISPVTMVAIKRDVMPSIDFVPLAESSLMAKVLIAKARADATNIMRKSRTAIQNTVEVSPKTGRSENGSMTVNGNAAVEMIRILRAGAGLLPVISVRLGLAEIGAVDMTSKVAMISGPLAPNVRNTKATKQGTSI